MSTFIALTRLIIFILKLDIKKTVGILKHAMFHRQNLPSVLGIALFVQVGATVVTVTLPANAREVNPFIMGWCAMRSRG